MAKQHVVQQGEHLSVIARQHGFFRYQTIWDDPANAKLKALRQNPNVLHPGDIVTIPDKQVKRESAATGRAHKFRVDTQMLELHVVLRDVNGDPLPGIECELEVDGVVQKLTTDGAGKIDHAIPVPAKGGKLRARGEEFLLAIGHLDPVEEQSGLRARLANLGYYLASGSDLDEEELRSAIEEFQVEHGLRVTGVADAATRAAIKKSHGS